MKPETATRLIYWLLSDDTGLSSKQIAMHMVGGFDIRNSPPSDAWDRGRCIRLLQQVPEWMERIEEMKQYAGWMEPVELIKKGDGK